MEDMKALSQHVIALQHQNRLVEKKVDVVGVIQTKVENKLDETDQLLSTYIERTEGLSNAEVKAQSMELTDAIEKLQERQVKTADDLHNLLQHVGTLDDVMVKSLTETLDQLDRQQLTNLSQLGSLSSRIEQIETASNKHMEHTQLDGVETRFDVLSDTVEHVRDENAAANAKVDIVLGRVAERAKELEDSTTKLREMNHTFAELMQTVETTLASVDEKVCQASPLYAGPSADDITKSFQELASMDVEGLLSTLKSDEGFDSDSEADVENIELGTEDAESELVELTDVTREVVDESDVHEFSETHEETEKRGFFARLFGKG